MTSPNDRACGVLDEIGRCDHSVTAEYRIFGPPGTGKTTNPSSRQIRRAVERFGPNSVLVTKLLPRRRCRVGRTRLAYQPDRVGARFIRTVITPWERQG